MPGRGGRVVLKAKWILIVLVMVSLVSTLLLGDTLTWLWSRTHANIDEVSVAKWGQENTGHSSLHAYFKQFMGSQASPDKPHNGRLDQAIALSQSSGDPVDGVSSHLTADLRVPGSDDVDGVDGTSASHKPSAMDARGRRHEFYSRTQVTIYTHRTSAVDAGTGRPRPQDNWSQKPHGVTAEATPISSSDVTRLQILYNKLLQCATLSSFCSLSLMEPSPWLLAVGWGGSWMLTELSAEICSDIPARDVKPGTYMMEIKLRMTSVSGISHLISFPIEQASLVAADVSVRGSSSAVKHHMALVESAFQKFNVKVKYQEQDGLGQWDGGQLPRYTSRWRDDDQGDDCETTWGWWLPANISTGAAGQFVPCGLFRSLNSGQRSGETIFVPLWRDLLSLDGLAPLVWQAEVLVTSWSPPRVYLHPAGIAWRGLEELVHRRHPKNSSLLDLEQLLAEWGDEDAARLTMTRLRYVLLEAVRSMGDHLGQAAAKTRPCHKCFQTLQILLVVDSTLQPIVLQVLPRQYTEHQSSLSDYLLQQTVLEDLVPLLVSRESTSADLVGPLRQLGLDHVREDMICDAHGHNCLGEHETDFLLTTRREQKSARNWIRLFPSAIDTCIVKHSAAGEDLQTELHESSNVESLALMLEAYHLCPVPHEQQLEPAAPVHRDDADVPFSAELPAGLSALACDRDNSSWPYLSAIHTYPYVQLYPEFSPLNTDYRAYVDYQTTLVGVTGVSKHCQVKVRLEGRLDTDNRWVNFSLGLGDNAVHLFIVSEDEPEATIHNIYRITIHRKQAGHATERKGDYLVCSLKQDCSLPISLTVACGLQPVVNVLTWTDFLHQHSNLPQCHDGDVSGEWMVPCFNCQNDSSCYWKQAVWQPRGCKEGHLGTDMLKDCLVGKRVLFIGDSTNRGILHYIFQRLNGSLLEWDKTHTIRIYPSLNDGQTMFGFAYYPQFWRRPGERPGLGKALYQLLSRTAEWSHKDTILVVGGVHWLAKHHLDTLVEIIRRATPSKWTVVVKGLGAGFHQPVQGVHQLSVKEQQQLWSHNQALLAYARGLGFSVVDTFSMTMSRFRDFRQGKCACHFHQLFAVQMSAVEKLLSPGSGVLQEASYHIHGHINAVYSDMVINRICVPIGG